MTVDGIKFNKDKKTGYYLSSKNYNGSRIRLHRYIWKKYNGEIPKGYDIHHIDHNKDNNNINNLMLVSSHEHKMIHSKELTEEQRDWYRENINKNARPKAIEWHKSNKGKEWHKKQYKVSLGKMKKEKMQCLYCGSEYCSINHGNNKFCSNKCKSAYRRKLGIDNIVRKCVECGKEFTINKYNKRQKCDDCKSKKSQKNRQRRYL